MLPAASSATAAIATTVSRATLRLGDASKCFTEVVAPPAMRLTCDQINGIL